MSVKVLTVASHCPDASYYLHREFVASLAKYGHKPITLGWGQPWGGLMTKPRRYREWLRANNSDDYVILCDAWDIVFAASPEDIVQQFPWTWGGDTLIVWNAERNCFPDAALAEKFPAAPYSFRFLNSGFAVGKACDFLRMFEEMKLDDIPDDYVDGAGNNVGPNDQLYIQHQFLKSLDWMALDWLCELCQTLHMVNLDELDFSEEKIRNRETGQFPLVFHANGGGKQIMEPILKHLGL